MRSTMLHSTYLGLLSALLFAGCGGDGNTSDAPGTSGGDTAQSTADAGDDASPAPADSSGTDDSVDDPGGDAANDTGAGTDYNWSHPNDIDGTLVAKRRTQPVEIDGQFDEPDYGAAMRYRFQAGSAESDDRASYRALWDDDALYLAARVVDDEVTHDPSADAFETDSAEILLDPRRDRSNAVQSDDLHLFGLAGAELVAKHGGPDGFQAADLAIESARTRNDEGYRVEIRIPWSELEAEPTRHNRLGLALAVNDLDGDGESQYSWPPTDALLDPSDYGDLRLGGETPADDVPEPGDDSSDDDPPANGCDYPAGPEADVSQTIELADEGLQEGDAIGPYLDDHFAPGNKVVIPDGTYEWNGSFGGDFDEDAVLCSEGQAVLEAPDETDHQGTITAEDGALVRIMNITFEGVAAAGKNRIAFQALDADAQIQVIGVRHPDGSPHGGHPSPIGFFVRPDNVGDILFEDCYVANFPNNGIYISHHTGQVVVDGCVFKNNEVDNLRMANDDIARNVLIVMDEGPYGHTGRGIRFRYPGEPTLENIHIVNSTGTSPIQTGSSGRMDGPVQATMEDVFIQNDGGGTPIDMKVGGAQATNVHITGSGDLSPEGVDGEVCTGSGCTAPETDIDQIR